jgi:hypothetical protein
MIRLSKAVLLVSSLLVTASLILQPLDDGKWNDNDHLSASFIINSFPSSWVSDTIQTFLP